MIAKILTACVVDKNIDPPIFINMTLREMRGFVKYVIYKLHLPK